jgi:hypothetical protein
MDEAIRQKIEEMIGHMQCPKDFNCAKNGLTGLCKARDFGLYSYLECLEDSPSQCTFALPFGNTYFCECPLRVYIEKKLKKSGEMDA